MNRIDKYLVEKGYTDSRIKAQKMIEEGLVECNGKIVAKSSFQVEDGDYVKVGSSDSFKYVSRGGLKLEKAINVFNIDLQDKTIMDIGSSTGGFTDCSLQHGAKKVIAIDVGTNLLHESLRANSKVELYEQTDIRNVSENLFNQIDLIVTDVSFISLKKIIDKIVSTDIKIDIVCLIKPQFECGKELAKKFKGVVTDKNIHNDILNDLIRYFNNNGYYILGLDFSPIKGGDGNIEYICYITNKINKNNYFNIKNIINNAFNNK